jgi:hypothetical protein
MMSDQLAWSQHSPQEVAEYPEHKPMPKTLIALIISTIIAASTLAVFVGVDGHSAPVVISSPPGPVLVTPDRPAPQWTPIPPSFDAGGPVQLEKTPPPAPAALAQGYVMPQSWALYINATPQPSGQIARRTGPRQHFAATTGRGVHSRRGRLLEYPSR